MSLKDIGFYFVTDSALTKKTIIDDVKSALKAGVKIMQYREKDKITKDMLSEAIQIKKLCAGRAILLVNDRIDIALAADADGVHLGQDDMPYHEARKLLGAKKIIGITAHNAEEAVAAEKLGADYIGASPIFETKTKKDAGRQAGLQLIRDIKKSVRIPVVAIGGINLENITSVMQAGADSAAAISVVVTKDDVAEECRKFVEIISNFKQPHTCR
jgi:thiamine-phosphate pyrophosphorylase